MKPPAFQFYAADFLVGTATMTAEEVGAYMRLLCYQWDSGAVPDDDATICRLGGCQASAVARIRLKFRSTPAGLKNPRMEHERDKQRLYREKQAENGAKRWAGNAKPNATAKPPHKPNGCSPSPIPSSVSDTVNEPRSDLAKPSAPRVRNALMDALALLETPNLEEVTNWGKHAAALSKIKKVCSDLTVEEINRRAANYPSHMSGALLTSTALANNWGMCGEQGLDKSNKGKAGWV